MNKKSIFYAFMVAGLMFFISSPLKATSENESLEKDFASRVSLRDDVLIEKEFVDYFKKIASKGIPIVVSVRVRDLSSACPEYENEKPLTAEELTRDVTKSFILEKFDEYGLSSFLWNAFRKHPSDVYEIRATIKANDPEHKEKVNGFCAIDPEVS